MASSLQQVSIVLLLIFSFSFVVAVGIDNPYLPIVKNENVTTITNYYNATNNSQYLQGYTPLTLRDYYETYFDTIYAPIGAGSDNSSWNETYANTLYCQLTGCTMEGNINLGGNNITNAGTITADYFVGDGSGLTGVATADTDFETFLNGSAYINITYNLTAGDVVNLERTIEPGKQFIFGDFFT